MNEETSGSLAVPARIRGRIDDLLNPILVKETRQALRGKYFRFTFLATLIVATVVGVTLMIIAHSNAEDQNDFGPAFFLAMFSCLTIGVQALVPFAAFMSMGSEWEENTYELLVISNLKPRQIVLGKLLASGVQAVLCYSSFLPFLVFPFLLRGTDLTAVLVLVGGSIVATVALSSFAICLSSLTRIKFVRIGLMAAMAAALVGATSMSIAMAAELIERPAVLQDPEALAGILGFLTIGIVFTAATIAVACARLAHVEENRTTGLRILVTGVILVGLGWLAYCYSMWPDPEGLSACGIAAAFLLLVPSMFFATEPETLGRRARKRIPRSSLLALLSAPYQPGGGRGLLLYVVLLGIVTAGLFTIYAWHGAPHSSLADEGLLSFLLAAAYGMAYLGIPTAITARYTGTLRGRAVAVIAVPIFMLLVMFVPALLGFFVGSRSLIQMDHPGSPPPLLFTAWDGDFRPDEVVQAIVVVLAAALGLALNVPRLVRGLRELKQASTERRAWRERGDDPHRSGGAPAGGAGGPAVTGASAHAAAER